MHCSIKATTFRHGMSRHQKDHLISIMKRRKCILGDHFLPELLTLKGLAWLAGSFCSFFPQDSLFWDNLEPSEGRFNLKNGNDTAGEGGVVLYC